MMNALDDVGPNVQTDLIYLGFRNGRCVASAWKQGGCGSDEFNTQTVSGWNRNGIGVRTLHKDDPAAKAAFDQMWQDAKTRAEEARAATRKG